MCLLGTKEVALYRDGPSRLLLPSPGVSRLQACVVLEPQDSLRGPRSKKYMLRIKDGASVQGATGMS